MRKKLAENLPSRRQMMRLLGVLTVTATWPAAAGGVFAKTVRRDNGWRAAVMALSKGADPAPGKISIEISDAALPRNLVPFTVTVDSPMSETEYVSSVHMFSTANKIPQIADFFFSPLSGKAEVSGRMRLERSQKIVAVARMNDGKFYIADREVAITRF